VAPDEVISISVECKITELPKPMRYLFAARNELTRESATGLHHLFYHLASTVIGTMCTEVVVAYSGGIREHFEYREGCRLNPVIFSALRQMRGGQPLELHAERIFRVQTAFLGSEDVTVRNSY